LILYLVSPKHQQIDLDSLSSLFQEQTQILKRLLFLMEENISKEEISSEVNKRPQTKKDQELLSFVCQQAKKNKYDPNTDPILKDFRKKLGY